MNLDGQKVLMVTVTIAVAGLLIATVGPATIGGLEEAVSDAEEYETMTEHYSTSSIDLYYNNTTENEEKPHQNVFNYTTVTNNSYEMESILQFSTNWVGDDETILNKTVLYYKNKDGSWAESPDMTWETGYIDANLTFEDYFNYVHWNASVTKTEYLGDGLYHAHLSYAEMTVSYEVVYDDATVNLLALIPVVVTLGLVMILIAIMKGVY